MIYSLLRAIVRPLLPIIDRIYTIAVGVKSLEASSSLICVELRRYKDRTVKLSDGCEVRRGDRVIKLHLGNAWITEKRQSSPGPRTTDWPRGLMHYFKESFRLLATQIANGKYGDVVAVYGWTVLHAPCRRLGFQVIDLPNTLRTKLAWFYITSLMRFYHIRGQERYKRSRESLKVKAIWLSRAEFLRLYRSC